MFIIYKGFSSIYKFIDNFPFQRRLRHVRHTCADKCSGEKRFAPERSDRNTRFVFRQGRTKERCGVAEKAFRRTPAARRDEAERSAAERRFVAEHVDERDRRAKRPTGVLARAGREL